MRSLMNNYGVLAIALYASIPETTLAGEDALYENLADVAIGDVFFSVDERERLDRQRRPKGGAIQRAPRAGVHQKIKDKGRGVFARSGGQSRVYENGDFVVSDSGADISFPDDIVVTRTRSSKTDDSEDSSAAGTEDDSG